VQRFKFKHKETVATIILEEEKYYNIVVKAILEARRAIEEKIREDPLFHLTIEPYECRGFIVERMCYASKVANVGPMASVAGVIAQHAVERTVEKGAEFVVVDNGGDIAMYLNRPLRVGLYTYTQRICFEVNEDGFYSICTSSGTIGHSISLGFADAATVFARDACIADAFATALCNEIKDEFDKREIKSALMDFWRRAENFILGALVVKGEVVGFVGKIPRVVRGVVKPDLITRG